MAQQDVRDALLVSMSRGIEAILAIMGRDAALPVAQTLYLAELTQDLQKYREMLETERPR